MIVSFRFAPVTKLLNRPGADWALGIAAALGTLILIGGAVLLHARGEFHLRTSDALLLLLAALCGACGFAGVRSWRRLWRAGRSRSEQITYDLGVRACGPLMFFLLGAMGGFLAWIGVGKAYDAGARMFVCGGAFMSFMIGLPLSLWAGFLWGSFMSGVVADAGVPAAGIRHDDLPPPPAEL